MYTEEQLNEQLSKAIALSGMIAGLMQPKMNRGMKISLIVKHIAPAGLEHPNKWANKLIDGVVARKKVPQAVIIEGVF